MYYLPHKTYMLLTKRYEIIISKIITFDIMNFDYTCFITNRRKPNKICINILIKFKMFLDFFINTYLVGMNLTITPYYGYYFKKPLTYFKYPNINSTF